MFIQRWYEDLTRLHVGTEPAHAYFIPDAEPADLRGERREHSDRFVSLDGDWAFRYYPSIYDLDAEVSTFLSHGEKAFYDADFQVEPALADEGTAAESTGFTSITVPSVWQMNGYDHQQYTNVRYPFPFDPPYVPQDNPCGVYLRDVDYDPNPHAPRAFLNFEGVDSCFYVWVNGELAGYSQVSHATSEFEVTDLLRPGRNRVAVLVLKWCDGSYLEDQDKFRMSGIFRSVYLLRRPQAGIRDYFVHTALAADLSEAKVSVDIDFLKASGVSRSDNAETCTATGAGVTCPVKASLYDQNGKLLESSEVNVNPDGGTASVSWTVSQPSLWNAEQPNLYRVELESFATDGGTDPSEVITDFIGIREVHVDDGVVKVNGQPVKIHGVNRHDGDPVTGFAIDQNQLMRDLKLMKEHNVNAIRTSHYPNAPLYYALYDQLGFYVIAEADIETHGIEEAMLESGEGMSADTCWNGHIADEPRFADAICDRVQRSVERDKNHPGIVIWSMGNESGYGCGFEQALAWTKQRDGSRLTHYESAIHGAPREGLDYTNLDLHSRMYPSIEQIDAYFTPEGPHGVCSTGDDGDHGTKPYFLCEFCHAMGNGPGDLEEYFEAIQRHPGMLGGCMWEWADHAIDVGRDVHGHKQYLYGGDHGEFPHDGNFCMDGLVYPDRTPHTGLKEFKNVFRPARVVSFNAGSGEATLHNYMDFVNLAEYLTISWSLLVDGEQVGHGELAAPDIAPHGDGAVRLPIGEVPSAGKVTLLIGYRLKRAEALLPKGFDLGFDEVAVAVDGRRNEKAGRLLEAGKGESQAVQPTVSRSSAEIVVQGADWRYTFDRRTGLIATMSVRNRNLLVKPAELNIWRAPTDNDRNIKLDWVAAGYDRTRARAYTCEVQSEAAGSVTVRADIALAADALQPCARVRAVWHIAADGTLKVTLDVTRQAQEFPFLPRFGLRLFLPKAMGQVEYCGYGPYESYQDKHRASRYGRFSSSAANMVEHYLRPQENGSHWGCDTVEVNDGDAGLSVAAETPFSFNCSPYTQEELTNKGHDYELEEAPYTVLCLDHAQSGMGSNSCGPELAERYRLDDEQFSCSFKLVPQVV